MTTQTAEVTEVTETPAAPAKPARRTRTQKTATPKPELTGLEAAKAEAAARDASVLNGVTRKDSASEPASPPKRRTRKAPAAAAAEEPAKPARRTRKDTATKAEPKAASEPKPAPAPKPDKQIAKRKLARELVEVVAAHFAEFSEADRRQVSKWIEKVPVGGPNGEHEDWGPDRWWAPQLPRPTYAPFQ